MSAERDRNLDGLRAVAAISIVGMHANFLVAVLHAAPVDALTLVRFGMWTAVNLFFALSGYVITLPFVRALLSGAPLPDVRAYLLRRAARILPAYWLALIALVLLTRPSSTAATATSHVLLLQDLVPGETRAVFPIAWSLGIESLFYVAVPLVAMAIRARWPGPIGAPSLLRGVAIVWAASSVVCGVGYVLMAPAAAVWQDLVHISLPATLFLFCPGIAIAVAEAAVGRDPGALRRYRSVRGHGSLLATVATLGWIIAVAGIDRHGAGGGIIQDQLLTVLCGLAVMGALHAGPRLSRAAAALAPVGVASYGVYLWHWVAAAAWARWLGPIHLVDGTGHLAWLAIWAALTGVAVGLGALSWILVERPARNWASAVVRRRRAVLAGGGTVPSPVTP